MRRIFSFIFACSLLLCLCLPVQAQTEQKNVTLPIEHWEQLKQNNQSLVLKLNELELQVEALGNPSIVLQEKLAKAEEHLKQSQMELSKLNGHLQNVKDLQGRTQESLTALTEQIDAERKKQEAIKRRLRWQRTLAYCLFGMAVIHK